VRSVQKLLVGKPEGKRPLRRCWHKWEGIIKMNLKKVGWNGVDWLHVAQDKDQWWALVNTVMNH
jgi:hypothetical protein